MSYTKRNFKAKNKTQKKHFKQNYNPEVKILKKDYIIYGAKNKDLGGKVLEYTQANEKKKGTHCVYENISWFAGLEQAKHYKGKEDLIFKWKVNKELKLIKITQHNKLFFKKVFLNTKQKIKPTIDIKNADLKKIDYDHPFLKMTNNEKCLYEFNFIFGYITLKEQYDFLLLIKYLIQNNFIEILSRHNTNLIPKINKKINFYKLYPLGKKEYLNRISLYEINKQSLLNLCKIIHTNYKIDGVYQPNTNSFWYPDLIVYHMNIEEFILFSPHTELVNAGIV
jgi:hypothetical protein